MEEDEDPGSSSVNYSLNSNPDLYLNQELHQNLRLPFPLLLSKFF